LMDAVPSGIAPRVCAGILTNARATSAISRAPVREPPRPPALRRPRQDREQSAARVQSVPQHATMCGRPRGFKSFEENSDAWVDCDHVFGLLTRHHDRWPRWNPRSGPKQSSDFKSHWWQRVFRIVDSTDRHLCQLFHPGIHARLRR
jgi:hypothetical protein